MQITIHAIRKAKDYTITEMARLLGISIFTYRYYERHPDLIPLSIALRIAKIGNISVDYIFFG